MPRPPCLESWTVPAAQVRGLDLLARHLTRALGGAWRLDSHGREHRLWRVQDRVRAELALTPQADGAVRVTLSAEPEYWSLRGVVPGAAGALAVPIGVGGALWSEVLLLVGLGLTLAATVAWVIASRPRPADLAPVRAQFEPAREALIAALATPVRL